MFGLTRLIATLESDPPVFEDLVIEALASSPLAPRDGLPPLCALERAIRDAHQDRLSQLELAGYLAGDHARKLFDELSESPDWVGGVRSRAARQRWRDEIAVLARDVHYSINQQVAAARDREKRRYRIQLEFAIYVCEQDEESSDEEVEVVSDDADTIGTFDSETDSD